MPVKVLVGAVVLAAGQSRRMGQPKMVLPWGHTTVIGQVVDTLHQAGTAEIVVVTGGARQEVELALQNSPAHTVFNPDYAAGDMLSSLQRGLRQLQQSRQPGGLAAALVALGDQPQMLAATVRQVTGQFVDGCPPLVAPSYQMRRGHPWLVRRDLWEAIFSLGPGATLREFLQAHAGLIRYVEVDTPTILSDLDTREDYQRESPTTP